MPVETLLLIRHGEVPEERRKQFFGHTDVPLDETGREQSRRLRKAFRRHPVGAVWSSPLARARETMEIAAGKEWAEKARFDDRLKEVHFGDWENLTMEEIERVAPPGLLRIWFEETDRMAFPGGESAAEFHRRIDAALADTLALPCRCAAWFTHGGVLLRILGKMPPRGSLTLLHHRKGGFEIEG